MQNFIIGLKLVFTMVSAILFPVIGLMACFCSAIIEYFVFKELLVFPGIGFNSSSWAALLVFVLEGAKFTLHFYESAFNKSGLEQEISDINIVHKRKQIALVKKMLISLSLVCSVIYMINVMYTDSSQSTEKIINEHNKECDYKFEEEKKVIENDRTKELEQTPRSLSFLKEELERKEQNRDILTNDLENERLQTKRADIQEELDKTREEIKELEAKILTEEKEFTNKVNEKYDKKIEELEKEYGPNGTQRWNTISDEILLETDNAYLKNFLLAFTRTLFGNEYNRFEYFICTLVIGIIIAVVLEYCISISQMLLSINVENLYKILGEFPPLTYGRRLVRILVWLMSSVLLNTAVYFMISIILQINAESDSIVMALLSYIMTIILVNIFVPKYTQDTQNSVKNSRNLLNFSKLRKIFFNSIIPASMAFVGYMLIGFIFNGDFVYGDLNGLAIACGGLFAKSIKYEDCIFKI